MYLQIYYTLFFNKCKNYENYENYDSIVLNNIIHSDMHK